MVKSKIRSRRAAKSTKSRRPVNYDRQAFNQLKPEFDGMVRKVAERMKQRADAGEQMTVDHAALEVVAELGAARQAQFDKAVDQQAAARAITPQPGSIIGVTAPVVTFVHYKNGSFVFVGGNTKRPLSIANRDTVQLVLEMIEGAGVIKIVEQDLRHLDHLAGAY